MSPALDQCDLIEPEDDNNPTFPEKPCFAINRGKFTLYDIGQTGQQLEQILTETEGEITPEIDQAMKALLTAGKDKIEAAAAIVRQLEAEADLCKTEAGRLMARVASTEHQIEALKERMVFALDSAYDGKVKTARWTVWTQHAKDSMSVAIAEGKSIKDVPESFLLPPAERHISKTAITNAVMFGQPIPEAIVAEIVPGKRFIRIK